MENIGEVIKKFWEGQQIKGLEGAPSEKIREFEEIHNVLLPDDFSDYLKCVNGSADYMEDECIEFHGLSKIQPVTKCWSVDVENGDYYTFADFLIKSHLYAIQLFGDLGKENKVAVFYDHEPIVVAQSFSEFIAGYLKESPEMLFP